MCEWDHWRALKLPPLRLPTAAEDAWDSFETLCVCMPMCVCVCVCVFACVCACACVHTCVLCMYVFV